ncbi:hypothetical protein TRIUR3_15532 [Triticum urartu]|uniref:Uncharacterized protein n=1 Tax=Triticum urartu TaxID=4572 RepID=M7Z111_TRIUA|nr:hypothetical protein TRIUR3_15532 [Triticum urartu]
MRSTQPPESWADLAGAVDSHPSLRAAMKNLSGLSRTSKWTMRASRARSHRSSLSASIHEESIHIARGARCEDGIEGTCPLVIDSPGNNRSTMLRHLKMSKDVTMQQKNLSSVLLTLVERHQRTTAERTPSKRNLETGEEPDCIVLWELTHTKNGTWSNTESQDVYDHSRKNTNSRKKQKTKHKIGSKTYSQLSFEKRNLETGEEPDCIVLWELTHTKNGTWSNTESQDVYDPKN